MYKYGPGDPEFLDEDQPPEPRSTEVFDNFWRKVAAMDFAVVIAVVAVGAFRRWDTLHEFALGFVIAGIGALAFAFLITVVSQAEYMNIGTSGSLSPFGGLRRGFDPMRRPDPGMRKLSLLLLVSGLILLAPGIALLLLTG
jgi:hypothetical protein